MSSEHGSPEVKMSVFFIYREFIYLAACSHTPWWGQEQALGVDSVLEILDSQRYLFSEFAYQAASQEK